MSTNPTKIDFLKCKMKRVFSSRLGTSCSVLPSKSCPWNSCPQDSLWILQHIFPCIDYKAMYLGIWSLGASF